MLGDAARPDHLHVLFHQAVEGRLALAMRLAMAALSLSPTDTDLQMIVRALGRVLAEDREQDEPKTDPAIVSGSALTVNMDAEDEPAEGGAADQARADVLLARVKGDPEDDGAVDELVDLLGRLGRDAELFALLSARWEDASPEDRAAMIPRQRAVLDAAVAADAQGRTIEAQLYRDALRALR